jgi:hypothetical protein
VLSPTQDTLERDLAIIFRAAPRRAGMARVVAPVLAGIIILLAVGVLLVTVVRQEPAGSPIVASAPPVAGPATAPQRPSATGYTAVVAVAPPFEAAPGRTKPAPAAVPSRSAKTTRLARADRAKSTERLAKAEPLPARGRLTLAAAAPDPLNRENQNAQGIDMGAVDARLARLETVDAIRTLRLR